MLRLAPDVYRTMVAHCYNGLPLEACGLLAGPPAAANHDDQTATACYPTANAAASARVYTVEPRDFLRADRDADAHNNEIVAVFHSHTHTDAYPSPTDIAQAPDPGWHYVLVSLRDVVPVVRSYRIVGGKVNEESVVLE